MPNTEEPRIYVIVAATVQPSISKSITQPCGRAMAQACHAVSMIRMLRIIEHVDNHPLFFMEPITTITLKARDSKELEHIQAVLMLAKIRFYPFIDTNDEVYGPNVGVQTAIATFPMDPVTIKPFLDYLPLWDHSEDIEWKKITKLVTLPQGG